ncbi:formate/nitrite transporter family protein [Niveibacterium sp. SC-1]|uniref:formate/nitrite transporter family protein n=1 Tax=Niveibacterium sp. SC-1 TaxID=3135646 RepID=UPI00311DBD93
MKERPVVEKAAHSGEAKAAMLSNDPTRYLVRSVLAGMYLSIVVLVYWSLAQGLHDNSFGKVIASAFFGVGLSVIVFTQAELFTSNCMYLAVSSAERITSWRDTMRVWTICYLGNLLGALLVTGLLWGAGVLGELPVDHALFTGAAHKVHQSAQAIFFKGILANWVVCLAIWVGLNLKEEMAKLTSTILVVFIFLYLGFEHSIANMGTFAMSLAAGGQISLGEALYNLIFSTLGNIVGGAVLVGFAYRFLSPGPQKAETEEVLQATRSGH